MYLVKNNHKTINIYTVKEHKCKEGNQDETVKTYRVNCDKISPVLDIKLNIEDSIKVDINFCPFCGEKL